MACFWNLWSFNLDNKKQFQWYFSLPENPPRVSPLINSHRLILPTVWRNSKTPQHTTSSLKSMRATPLTIVLNAIITAVFACWPLEVIGVDWPKISSCNVLLHVHGTIANRYACPRGIMGRLVSGVSVNVQEMWRYSWFSPTNRNSVTFSILCELIIPNKVSKINTVLIFSLQTLPCLQRKPYITNDFPLPGAPGFQIRLISLHSGDVLR